MARACIENMNNWMPAFLEKLRTDGKIVKWEWAGGPRMCFEFNGHLEIDISDMHDAVPDFVLKSELHYKQLISIFKKHVILMIINTLQGGVIHGFTDTYIELESTERTRTICFRVTEKEKEKLEQEAREQGLSLSDYIRGKLGL